MIEKLLQFLIGEIDTKLFETVEFKNFEAGNIQNSDEKGLFDFGWEGPITSIHQPFEQFVIHGFTKAADRVANLVFGSTLGHKFVSNLDFGLE